MASVEEMIAIRATPQQAMRQLVNPARFADWVAPDVSVTPHTRADTLGPGDRLRLELLGGLGFDYTVEAATDREIVFSFRGPWRGEERWSFIADGAETIARRSYDVRDADGVTGLVWRAVGRPLVMGHFKVELARFRALVERDPGPAAEIEASAGEPETTSRYEVDEG